MEIANTLQELSYDSTIEEIMDRESDIDEVVEEVLEDWGCDLYERKPASAYNGKGEFKGTDLDLATFMQALAARNAVINLPTYESRRTGSSNGNEWLVSPENRHGKIVGLGANKDVFSFSVRVYDQNIVDKESGETGAYRNFLLTDLDGTPYNGWDGIQFVATEDEEDFLQGNEITVENVVALKNFVHPNAWRAFYGTPYLKAKALEQRLTDEAKHYRAVAKSLELTGIELDEGEGNGYSGTSVETISQGNGDQPRSSSTPQQEGTKIQVEAFNAEVDMPELYGNYPEVSHDPEGLAYAKDRARELTYSVIPRIRFATRAVELAFYKHGNDGENNPGWEVPEWEEGHKTSSRARIEWNKLDFGNGFGLRYRTKIKTETVR